MELGEFLAALAPSPVVAGARLQPPRAWPEVKCRDSSSGEVLHSQEQAHSEDSIVRPFAASEA